MAFNAAAWQGMEVHWPFYLLSMNLKLFITHAFIIPFIDVQE